VTDIAAAAAGRDDKDVMTMMMTETLVTSSLRDIDIISSHVSITACHRVWRRLVYTATSQHSTSQLRQNISGHDSVLITRLWTDHCLLTHSYLLSGDYLPTFYTLTRV